MSWLKGSAIGLGVAAMIVGGALTAGLVVALQRDPTGILAARSLVDTDPSLKGLPLFVYPATRAGGDTLVVFYSGDNGWAKTDRNIAQAVADGGEPVVGVDSLRYLLTPRSADEAAGDLSAVIAHFSSGWARPHVVLAGYSYGADALPLIYARLSPAARVRISGVVLISPGQYGRLVFRPYDWLDINWPGSTRIAGAMRGFGATPVVCVQGAEDADAACRTLRNRSVRLVVVPGGHRFKGVYQAVAAAIASV